MKSKFQIALAALVIAFMTLAPAAANAAAPGSAHMRARLFHERGPRVHSHGIHSHR